MTFEGVDVEAVPDRLRDLQRLGIPRVPATVISDRFVHGWNPKALADLVGVEYAEPSALSPEELSRRLDLILAAAQRAMCQIPADHLEMKGPGRDRSVKQLGFHIFRLSAAFREAREKGHLPDTWFRDAAPAGLTDGKAIARHGQTVREQLREWYRRPGWCDGTVGTYYGTQSAHALMERTTWHAAQHLRQLYWFLGRMGVEPEAPLTDADLKGLPFPKDVWS